MQTTPIGHIAHDDVLTFGAVQGEPIEVVLFLGDSGVEIEPVLSKTGNRHLGFDATQIGEHVNQPDPADPWKTIRR